MDVDPADVSDHDMYIWNQIRGLGLSVETKHSSSEQ